MAELALVPPRKEGEGQGGSEPSRTDNPEPPELLTWEFLVEVPLMSHLHHVVGILWCVPGLVHG